MKEKVHSLDIFFESRGRDPMWIRAIETLEEAHEVARFNFVVTECALAITYCKIAMSADDDQKADRNIKNASQAYGAAVRFLDKGVFPPEVTREVAQKLTEVKQMLRQLGEYRGD